jgi:hypothetical protein
VVSRKVLPCIPVVETFKRQCHELELRQYEIAFVMVHKLNQSSAITTTDLCVTNLAGDKGILLPYLGRKLILGD